MTDPHRPRPRNLQRPPRRNLPRRLHLLHPPPHYHIQPLPDPTMHARLSHRKALWTSQEDTAMA